MKIIITTIHALIFLALAFSGYQLYRCANCLNESNKIMVGVENGELPPGGNFHKSDPAQSF